MATQKHTPTPWVRDGHNLSAIIRLKFPKGHPECKHITGTYETLVRCEGENWEANAAFIVRACNAHDELVGALEQLKVGLVLRMNREPDHKGVRHDLETIDAALAKARGEA